MGLRRRVTELEERCSHLIAQQEKILSVLQDMQVLLECNQMMIADLRNHVCLLNPTDPPPNEIDGLFGPGEALGKDDDKC